MKQRHLKALKKELAKISPREIGMMCDLFGKCGYNDVNKAEWKRLSMKFCRALRDELGIGADVRFNPGGIAVSGDATIHADNVHVFFNADLFPSVVYRKCKGRKDYTGDRNNTYTFERLRTEGVRGLAEAIRSLLQVPTFEVRETPVQPSFTDCPNCGSADHVGYNCPCKCHARNSKAKKFEVSMADLQNDMANEGICLACGHRQGGCEPDAREYKCENEDCGQNKVYGLQEAMFMDAIEVTE